MDYGWTSLETKILQWTHRVVDAHGGVDRLVGSAIEGTFDCALDAALADAEVGQAPLHHRLLVVEEVARLGLPALPGPRLVIGREILGQVPLVPTAVADRDRLGPVRIAPYDALLLSFDDRDAWAAAVAASQITALPSSFGYPYGQVAASEGAALSAGAAGQIRALWHLSMASEIAGNARGALDGAASYLRERQQFGRQLSSFQALRHRIAELAVSTEAVVWLAREAAWHGDPGRAATAACYARQLAAKMAPELVQLCGARGFTLEFPVHLFAMRLEGLRLELGSADRLAGEVWVDPAERMTV
jgi:hypothetical protein